MLEDEANLLMMRGRARAFAERELSLERFRERLGEALEEVDYAL
jgi:hypothetical protein